MRIEFTVDVFVDPSALPDLLGLLRCVAEGRHDWEADQGVAEAARRYLREHSPRLAATYAELGRKGVVAAAWRGGVDRTKRIMIRATNLGEHAADLVRPAVLVVENHESDGAFVRAVARIFRAGKLSSALDRRWLEVRHGGGETVAAVAEAAAEGFRRLTRVAVVLDSDRMFPGQRTAAEDKAGRLTKSGIATHVLELREAENYVPNRVLASLGKAASASRKVRLLRRLTPAQRGHFDMKQGFGPADRPPVIRPEQQALFTGLDHQVLNGLREGFGRYLLQRMEAMSQTLREEDFAGLGPEVPGELRRMLDSVTNVI